MVNIPAMGRACEFGIHLGKMALPTSFRLQLALHEGEEAGDAVVRTIAYQGADRNRHWDCVKSLQVV